MRENEKRIDYDYKVGDKKLVRKDGILCKQSLDGLTNHGPLPLFIRMEQSG